MKSSPGVTKYCRGSYGFSHASVHLGSLKFISEVIPLSTQNALARTHQINNLAFFHLDSLMYWAVFFHY